VCFAFTRRDRTSGCPSPRSTSSTSGRRERGQDRVRVVGTHLGRTQGSGTRPGARVLRSRSQVQAADEHLTCASSSTAHRWHAYVNDELVGSTHDRRSPSRATSASPSGQGAYIVSRRPCSGRDRFPRQRAPIRSGRGARSGGPGKQSSREILNLACSRDPVSPAGALRALDPGSQQRRFSAHRDDYTGLAASVANGPRRSAEVADRPTASWSCCPSARAKEVARASRPTSSSTASCQGVLSVHRQDCAAFDADGGRQRRPRAVPTLISWIRSPCLPRRGAVRARGHARCRAPCTSALVFESLACPREEELDRFQGRVGQRPTKTFFGLPGFVGFKKPAIGPPRGFSPRRGGSNARYGTSISSCDTDPPLCGG